MAVGSLVRMAPPRGGHPQAANLRPSRQMKIDRIMTRRHDFEEEIVVRETARPPPSSCRWLVWLPEWPLLEWDNPPPRVGEADHARPSDGRVWGKFCSAKPRCRCEEWKRLRRDTRR